MVELSIRKRYRKNGTIMYEYRFEIATVNGGRKWKTKCGFKTKAEAQRAGKAALQQYENFGQVIEKDEISYSDYLDYWIENDCKVDLKPNTAKRYQRRVNFILKPRLGGYKLKSITREILQAFMIEIYDAGYAHNSLVTIKGLLTKSFNFAEDHHFIHTSPAVRLKIPKNRVPKVKTRSQPHHYIPPLAMEKIFARFPERSSSYIPLKIGYECGMRLGEVFGLCWEDVDFKKKVLKINRQVQWMIDDDRDQLDKIEKNGSAACGKGYWYFAEPKYKSYRVIELSDDLIELLSREKERQDRAKEYYGIFYAKYFSDEHLLFSGEDPEYLVPPNRISQDDNGFPIHFICVRENGTYITPRTMQHVSKVIKRDIFPDFDFHSLRVSHASMLAGLGVEPKYIQTRLGHTDLELTINVYERVTDMMSERGRKAINELYSK